MQKSGPVTTGHVTIMLQQTVLHFRLRVVLFKRIVEWCRSFSFAGAIEKRILGPAKRIGGLSLQIQARSANNGGFMSCLQRRYIPQESRCLPEPCGLTDEKPLGSLSGHRFVQFGLRFTQPHCCTKSGTGFYPDD